MTFLIYPHAFAGNQCESLFSTKSSSKITEKPSATKRISHIQNIEWLKKKLFKDGEMEKLKKSDALRDHNEFLSNMLSETIKILKRDFHQKDSELKKIEGASFYLEAILQNISLHQAEHKVTHDYYIRINYAISKFIALKNSESFIGNALIKKISAQKGSTVPQKIKQNFEEDLIAYRFLFEGYKEEGLQLFPLFADLTPKDFIDLGVELVPLGMTLNARSTFDGRGGRDAHDYFIHDLLHAQELLAAWSRLSPADRARYVKFEKFLSSPGLKLTHDETVLLYAYVFKRRHEKVTLEEMLKEFYGERAGLIKKGHEKEISEVYEDLANPLKNTQYDIILTKQEYLEILNSALSKTSTQFEEFRIEEFLASKAKTE
ncbi:MAG: hypothetical protein V4596_04940 [Bdellovibrionota bacterium]